MNEKKNVNRIGKFLWVIPVLVLSIVLMSMSALLMQNGEGQQISKVEKEELKASNAATSMTEAQSDDMLAKTVNSHIQDEYGNLITIPAGFKIKVDEDTNNATTVDKGIVIIDKDENEFVWIPVPEDGKVYTDAARTEANAKTVELNRYTFDETTGEPTAQNDAAIGYGYQELQESTRGNTTAKSITNFKKSVADNKGYYIGRYEARKNTDGIITEKGTDSVYNSVTQPNAATAARNMYDNTNPFTSDLMNSYAWDTATLFLQRCGDNETPYSLQKSINNSSSPAYTGTNNQETKDVQCNVYDMASNLFEWSTETPYSGYYYIHRGGGWNGTTHYTSLRTASKTWGASSGFRPIIYIEEKIPDATEGNESGENKTITVSEITWENGKAQVTITTDTDYKIEYQINGTDEDKWEEATGDGKTATITDLDNNTTVYVRLTDGTNSGKYATIEISDTKEPEEFRITVTDIDRTGFTVSGSTTDAETGIKDYTYIVEPTTGDPIKVEHTTEENYTFTGLEKGTEYKVYMIAYDNAGNERKSAEETITTDASDWEYVVINENEVELTKYLGTDTEIVMPSIIDGYTVTSIGESLFEENKELTSIEIPSSVTNIGNSAFDGCTNLTSVGDLSNVTTIGAFAFCECSSLTTIGEIPNVTSIGAAAFNECSSLTSINLPSTITTIENNTFGGCTSLTSVGDLSNVTTIEMYAFSGCSSLESVGDISNVTTIGDFAFGGCSSLTRIDVPTSVTTIGEIAFKDCTNLTLGVYTDSTAHQYAEENSINSILLDGIKEIALTTTPSKTTYKEGETTIDLTGGVITVTYNDGTSEDIPMVTNGAITEGITTSGFDTTELGNKEITISYNGVEVPVKLEIEVIQKLDYEEKTDPEGNKEIIITGPTTPGEGEEENKNVVIPDNIDGKPVTEIGDKAFAKPVEVETIEIPDSVIKIADNAFEGNEDAIIICNPGSAAEQYAKDHDMSYIYKDKTITGISVLRNPDKVEYLENKENLDVTGGRLTVTYAEEGLTSKVRMTSPGVETDGFDNTIAGTNEVTVTFREQETTFEVTIIANTYTVTFKNDDGTTIKTITVESGSKVEYDGQTPTKNNVPTGYEATFNGWTDAEKLENVTSDTTVTATYTVTPIVYTITYENIENSDISDTTKYPTSYTVEDLDITLENLPNQEKLNFKGWYTTNDESGNKVETIDISKLGNITLYARWEQVQEQEELWFKSDAYKIGENDIDNYEEGDLYVEKISPETTVKEFIENCESNGDIIVTNEKGEILEEDDLVGTNMTIKVTKDNKEITLTAVVMGDLDGNGLVTVTDLSGINQTVLKVIKLEGAILKAADLDDNNEITVTDLSGVNQKILKVIELKFDKSLLKK